MRHYKANEINALARGLETLRILHKVQAASLHELHQATHIPKSTLTRILHTLHLHGYIWQRMADGAFLPSLTLYQRAWQSYDPNWLVEVANPFLESLCEKVAWPSVLSVPRLDYMEVVETNSPKSYFHEIPLGPIGFRANMLRSASGRTYLSFCPDQEREAILERLRKHNTPAHALAHDQPAVDALVAQTRSRGYATRADDFGGHYELTRDQVDDERMSFAVPVMLGNRVLCCLNITWRRNIISMAKAEETLLPFLFESAESLSQAIQAKLDIENVADR